MRRRTLLALHAAAALCLAAFGLPEMALGAADGFTLPSYVDTTLAGGEPLVLADNVHHTFIYTSHEGTTHLYRTGSTSLAPVLFNYRNQVNIWTSDDGGAAWRRVSVPGGFPTNPAKNTGFSDPDLTQDEGGRVYNTGINLVNDALFSSNDGGLSWDKGTAQCHDGDRPWLAGAQAEHVFMATDAAEESLEGSGHTIYESTDGGNSCGPVGISDFGDTPDGGSYTGYGKLYYNHRTGQLVEPVIYTHDGVATGIGASVWKPGDLTITPVKATDTTLFSHFPIVVFDNADNLYLVWDTDDRKPDTAGSCEYSPGNGNSPDPLPNHVMMAVSTDFGKTWGAPVEIAGPSNARVLWPWAVAGDAGKLSIVWYQTDKLVDPDCQASNVYIYEARVDNATDPATRKIAVSNASKRPIHQNGVCQGGTLCVANGKDRRLGDFFTNAIDPRGCVMIASGDTTQLDPNTGGPLPVSLPIFQSQDSGNKLVGSGNCGPKRKPANPGRPTCSDRRAPASTLPLSGFRRRGKHRLSFRGRAKDLGCRAAHGLGANGGRLKRVDISLARVLDRGCRFVNPKGRLTPRSNCRKPILMRVHGKRRWRFRIKVHVPPGNYRAVVRAVDVFGNKEQPSHRRNQIRFVIR